MVDALNQFGPVNETALRLKKIIDMQSMLVSMEFNLPDFMQAVVEQVQAVTSANGAVVELLESNELLFQAASGIAIPYIGRRLPLATSLSGLCVSTGEVLVSMDSRSDPRVDSNLCRESGAASMVMVPLRRFDAIIGVLTIISLRTHAFGDHEIDMLRMMAGLLGAAIGQQVETERRVQLEAKLIYMAQHDALTGLPNRSLFEDRLGQALNRRRRVADVIALMYIDIDNFKVINDSHGHAIGDAVLKVFAERMQILVRDGDTLARCGGDEFALIAENLRNSQDADNLAVEILKAMHDVCEIGGHQINVTASIGIAIVSTADATNTETLLRRADTAMYAAKKAGRNTFRSVSGGFSAVALPTDLRRSTA